MCTQITNSIEHQRYLKSLNIEGQKTNAKWLQSCKEYNEYHDKNCTYSHRKDGMKLVTCNNGIKMFIKENH